MNIKLNLKWESPDGCYEYLTIERNEYSIHITSKTLYEGANCLGKFDTVESAKDFVEREIKALIETSLKTSTERYVGFTDNELDYIRLHVGLTGAGATAKSIVQKINEELRSKKQ